MKIAIAYQFFITNYVVLRLSIDRATKALRPILYLDDGDSSDIIRSLVFASSAKLAPFVDLTRPAGRPEPAFDSISESCLVLQLYWRWFRFGFEHSHRI